MSFLQASTGYVLGPEEGEALWFKGGLGILKATGDLTQGRFAALELLAPGGFASPLHIHRDEDEFREGGKPARSLQLPPADEQFLDKQTLAEIASRYHQEFVGPPLPPKNLS